MLPAHLHLDEELAWSRILGARISVYLDVLAVLDSWRTATAEQLAALSGVAEVATGRSFVMADLFAVGLVDVGVFASALGGGGRAARAELYRPSRTNVFDRQLAPKLTRAEWVSVTGGHPFSSSSQFDRHNILTTELALRAVEMGELGAAMGEKLSSWDLLAHSGVGFPAATGRARHADATLIRPDGLRIAIEMTASTSPSFQQKVKRWATLLHHRRMADSGLVVLFVVAGRPDMQVRPAEALGDVRKAIAAAVRDSPGVSFDRTAERMMAASWLDWFPTPGQVEPSFLDLAAYRPTGPVGATWEPISPMDELELPLEPSARFDPTAVFDNVPGLRSQPAALRREATRQLWPEAVRAAGFTSIPAPAPARPGTYQGRPLGAARGASSTARAPKRLRLGP
ncbi:hypothetical protein OVN20_05325 [Microcella daejeonensis]|uniref:hypothetical protein n=1 Tax=Microcella daejeonensis TaxID=2994971 RepID=UPI002271C306|nr:hypothetical protein [Microcella daejeonensis]WAB84973.1 hypothetical protein OVN20_05325 [Microcella daejeonensis]